MRSVLRPFVPILALALAAPVVAACNDDDDTTGTEAPLTGVIETESFAPSLGVNLPASTRTTTGLYYRQLAPSTASGVPVTAAVGQRVNVRYTGWLANGRQFDSGTIPFTLGARAVIAGWDQGIVGMRVGEQRQLIIPPSLGYGAAGNGPIPGNAVLVFNVELLSATAQ
jgi:peptidylprolyl isomerase